MGPMPKSPGDMPRESLPIRKRPLLEVRRDLHTEVKSPKPEIASPSSFGGLFAHPAAYQHLVAATAPPSPLHSAPPR